MKRLLPLMLAIALVLTSVAAFAAPTATKHNVENNVYVEGTVGEYVKGEKLRLTITEGEKVVYVGEYDDAVKGDGSYSLKFKHTGDLSDANINVQYAKENVTSSAVATTETTAVLEAEVMVTDSNDRAFDLDIDQSIPSHTFPADNNYSLNEHTYKDDYEVPAREGLKAVVNLKNKYAYETDCVLMVVAYDENKKMLGCTVETIEAEYGENGEAVVYDTAVINVPDGTKYAKAFCWNSANLIPYGKEADGTLPQVDVFCIGDSTGADWGRRWYPQAGWGTYLQDYLNEYATVHNLCRSGAWAQSLLEDERDPLYGVSGKWHTNGQWKTMIESATPGDYVIVSLGINDMNKYGPDGMAPIEWYDLGISRMVEEAIEAKLNIILCSSLHDGVISTDSNRQKFIDRTEAIAKRYDVPFLNYSAEMEKVFVTLGTNKDVLQKYYLDYETFIADPEKNPLGFGLTEEEIASHGNSNINNKSSETIHPNIRGVNLACQKIVECLKDSTSPLRFYVK